MKNVIYSKVIRAGCYAEDGETATILTLTEEVNFLLIVVHSEEAPQVEALFPKGGMRGAIETAVDRARQLIEQSQVEIEQAKYCPHGEPPDECEACMIASDHAFDSAREDRMFGR